MKSLSKETRAFSWLYRLAEAGPERIVFILPRKRLFLIGLLALLLLLLGHAINLGLAIMSGVVHGLRLNFIEFYKWGVPGEGKAFQKFARKEVKP